MTSTGGYVLKMIRPWSEDKTIECADTTMDCEDKTMDCEKKTMECEDKTMDCEDKAIECADKTMDCEDRSMDSNTLNKQKLAAAVTQLKTFKNKDQLLQGLAERCVTCRTRVTADQLIQRLEADGFIQIAPDGAGVAYPVDQSAASIYDNARENFDNILKNGVKKYASVAEAEAEAMVKEAERAEIENAQKQTKTKRGGTGAVFPNPGLHGGIVPRGRRRGRGRGGFRGKRTRRT